MQIYISSVFVDDQDKALAFYSEMLGFIKKVEVPLGEHRWLTVVSPDAPDVVTGPTLEGRKKVGRSMEGFDTAPFVRAKTVPAATTAKAVWALGMAA